MIIVIYIYIYILAIYTFSKSHHLWGSHSDKPFLSFLYIRSNDKKNHQPPPGRSFKEAIFRLGKQCPIWSSWTFRRTSGRQLLGIPAWNSMYIYIYVELLRWWYCFLQVQENHQTMALTRSTYEKKKQRALWKGNDSLFRAWKTLATSFFPDISGCQVLDIVLLDVCLPGQDHWILRRGNPWDRFSELVQDAVCQVDELYSKPGLFHHFYLAQHDTLVAV